MQDSKSCADGWVKHSSVMTNEETRINRHGTLHVGKERKKRNKIDGSKLGSRMDKEAS